MIHEKGMTSNTFKRLPTKPLSEEEMNYFYDDVDRGFERFESRLKELFAELLSRKRPIARAFAAGVPPRGYEVEYRVLVKDIEELFAPLMPNNDEVKKE